MRYLAVVLLSLAACARAVSAPNDALPLTLRPADYRSTTFAIEGGAGQVVVRDRTVTGVCHRREERQAYLEAGVVVLRIADVMRGSDICIALGKAGAYEATIGGLAPGEYRVRVVYEGDISTDTHPLPALEATVTVR